MQGNDGLVMFRLSMYKIHAEEHIYLLIKYGLNGCYFSPSINKLAHFKTTNYNKYSLSRNENTANFKITQNVVT